MDELQKDHMRAGKFTVVIGGLGMTLSFLFLGSGDGANIAAGASGFIAGAILIGTGLIACTLTSWHRDSATSASD